MQTLDPVAITTDYGGETTSIRELYRTLQAVAEAGFSHIQWCHEWDTEYIYAHSEMQQIKSWLDDLGLKVEGIHASEGVHRPEIAGKFHFRNRYQDRKDYTSFNPYNRQAGVELILNRLELANVLETDTIVLHMQLPYAEFSSSKFKNRYYQAAIQSFQELQTHKTRGSVKICLENMIGTPNQYQFAQFDLLFDQFPPEYLGFCYDIGHEHITTDQVAAHPVVEATNLQAVPEPPSPSRTAAATDRPDALESAASSAVTNPELAFPFLHRYSSRLYAVHFSDNLGLLHDQCWQDDPEMTKCDLHLLPYKGTINYSAALPLFADSAFSGAITLEVSQRNRDRAEFLQAALQAGTRISQVVRHRRESRSEN